MKKLLLFLACFIAIAAGLPLRAADAILPLRFLYIGHRADQFTPLLKQHFATVDAVARDQFQPKQADAYDVVLLDWPQSHQERGAWLDGSPLGKREDWKKPTVLLGSAGLNLAVAWKLHGGSGCTCLAPVAYNLRPHQIFTAPIPIDTRATTIISTPEQFVHDLPTNATIEVMPLIDGISNYHTVIRDHPAGWSSHYYEFADMPDVEVFSGGINEQTARSAAFWRQGNLLHFGFEQSPAEMNAVGRAMLVNAIAYISHFTQDHPIDVSASVFGPEQIAVSRKRARGYFKNWPGELPKVFSAEALASFDWHNTNAAQAWFDTNRNWIHPNSQNLLEVDEQAKSLNVVFDSPDFFPKSITALRDDKTGIAAQNVLARYAPEGPGVDASADAWDAWYKENAPYLFYSELGGYRWYIDPLAKKRGIPSKDLRGLTRMDVAISQASR